MRAMGRLLTPISPLVLAILLAGQPAAARPAAERGTEAHLRAHIEELASDAMEGRKPGTPGGDLAVRYVAGQFAAIGLQPGARDGGYYAPVPLVERTTESADSEWWLKGVSFPVEADDFALRATDALARIADAPLIFGGYGIDDAKGGIHPFKDMNVDGAVVLILPGNPDGLEGAPPFAVRRDALFKVGARAVIRIETDKEGWPAIRDAYSDPRTDMPDAPAQPVSGALSPDAWERLVEIAGLQAAIADAAKPSFRAVKLDGSVDMTIRTRLRRYTSWNVVGRLPGADAKAGAGSGAGAAGAILYLAHWDHLGICRPEGAPDRICNGAVDNASGVAMMIEVARGLAAAKRLLPRDIYFVATSAEEMGLIGARTLAKEPPVDAAHIKAVVNFDTVAIAPRGAPVATLGRGRTPLDPMIDAAARKVGRKISESTDANVLTPRQDGWAFTQIGVPAVMVGGSLNMDLLTAYLGDEYHKPGDDLSQPLPLDGVAEDVRLHVVLGRMLADPRRYQPPPR